MPINSTITEKGCALFGVEKERFTNWRWQMKHQIQAPTDFDNLIPFPTMKKKPSRN